MKTLALVLLPLVLGGCVHGKGWQGLVPDKDVEIVNPMMTLMTPWGQETLKADRIATRLRDSTNPLPPLVPASTNQGITIVTPTQVFTIPNQR